MLFIDDRTMLALACFSRLNPRHGVATVCTQVIPNLELTEGCGDFIGEAPEIEPTHFFGLFDGCVD